MQSITLKIVKDYVYREVKKSTSYAGSKNQEDATAYDRVRVVDTNEEMLERFWAESCSAATEVMKPFDVVVNTSFEQEGQHIPAYIATLSMSNSYDNNLTESVEASLFSFFVSSVIGKWMRFASPKESESYGADAIAYLEDVERKLFYRKKPVRVAPV